MKRLTYIFAAILSISACTKEKEEILRTETLDVSLLQTRIQISDGQSVWNNGDLVSVFYMTERNEKWTFSGSDGFKSGKLVHTGRERGEYTGEEIIAMYPYDPEATLDGQQLTTDIPSGQKYIKNGYINAVLTSRSKGTDLYFRYATAMLGIRMSGLASIRSVTLKGLNDEAIAGKVTINLSEDSTSLTLTGSEKTVTMEAEDGDIIIDGEQVLYFSIAPTSFHKGYMFTITYSDGRVQECKSTIPVVMKAGHYKILECDVHDTRVTNLLFSDAGTRVSPIDFYGNGKPAYGFTDLITGDRLGPFHLFEDEEKNFPLYMYIQSKYSLENPDQIQPDAFRITSGGGLKFGGRKGDWMQFPPLEGHVLRAIYLQASNTTPVCITTAPEEGEGEIVEGGEERSGTAVFRLGNSTEGAAYRLTVQSDACIGIMELTLKYERI